MSNEFFMQLAINEAFKYIFVTYPNPAVGAVVVKEGAIVGIGAHQRVGTSHAEVVALLNAYEHVSGQKIEFEKTNAQEAHKFLEDKKDIFKECEIYVTLEPCSHEGKTPSCAKLISRLQLKKVYIGSKDPIASHSGGIEILKQASIEVEEGVLKNECDTLLEPFVIWQKRAFVLFKLAQTTNGKIGGGYISSKESLEHVHKIRAVASKLVIGGNTVRVDRPTLDCRFINAKAPDIYIYSKQDNFDRAIPLFNVPHRSVAIGDSLDFLKEKGLILVEGGEGMLKAMQKYIDWLLIFQAPKLSKNSLSYNIDSNLEFVHIDKNSTDLIIWSRYLG